MRELLWHNTCHHHGYRIGAPLRDNRLKLGSYILIVVDEAAMVDTGELATYASATTRAGSIRTNISAQGCVVRQSPEVRVSWREWKSKCWPG